MKTIVDLLKKHNSELTKLLTRAKSYQDLDIIFHTALDVNLVKYCHVASYKGSELTITVTNSSIATRLRFLIPEIIKQLKVQPEFKTLTKIRYVIVTTQSPQNKPRNKITKLSPDNEILWKKTLLDLREKTKAKLSSV